MHLKLFRHLWGIQIPWEEAFPKIKSLGYAGVETLLPDLANVSRFVDLVQQYELQLIAGVHTQGSTVREHIDSLRRQVELARKLNARFVATQAGRDSFIAPEIKDFYSEALRIEADTDIPIAFETHRGRPLFNPWATASILNEFPALKLVCDLSHWVCVTERLPDDCLPIIKRAADQTYHIHARVGYSQGPQVPDPRMPEYQKEVDAHERWWDLMWDSQQRRGFDESTMCPEFGPPPYLHTNLHSGQPAANLWDVVEWQRERQMSRFKNRLNLASVDIQL